MNYITPNYYDSFKCTANKCNHSCCIGWEIDVDEISLEKYKNYPDICKRISKNGGAHFMLDENERCPFLNRDNLCDIIITHGEEMLCQICDDHPRFRNFFSDRIETGLGLCCEAAAHLILNYENKTELIGTDNSEKLTHIEREFMRLRDSVFKILQNRDISIDKRISQLLDTFDIDLNTDCLYDKYRFLERLDKEWDSYLERLCGESKKTELEQAFQLPFEQLTVYLVYRHFADGLDDGRYRERIGFIAQSYYVIKNIFTSCKQSMDELIQIVRLYSSEIEYSDQNVTALLDNFTIPENKIQQELFKMQDIGYKFFQSKLIPNIDASMIIGVRTPELRKFAKNITNTNEAEEFLNKLPHRYYEENNLHGFLIERAKGFENAVAKIERFLPYVDNWATCDSVMPKEFKRNSRRLFPYIDKWIKSGDTYTVRYAIKMLMNLFLDDDFDVKYLEAVADVKSCEYYVNMMRAWYFATALAKQYDSTLPYLQNNLLDTWTHNKTIQKAIESYRISMHQKKQLIKLKRPSK